MKYYNNQSKLLKQKRIASNIKLVDMPVLYTLCEIGVFNIKNIPVITAIDICKKLNITIEELYSIAKCKRTNK